MGSQLQTAKDQGIEKLTQKSRMTLVEATFKVKNAQQQGECLNAGNVEKWLAVGSPSTSGGCGSLSDRASQTERRVFKGEKVPAQEQVVSLNEPHTDIIVKDRRQVQYGHKLNLVL